jgi:hypothetical protein
LKCATVLFLNPDELTFGTALLRSHLAGVRKLGCCLTASWLARPAVKAHVAVEPLSLTDVDGLGEQIPAVRRLPGGQGTDVVVAARAIDQQFAEDLTRPEPRVRLSLEERLRRLEAEREEYERRDAEEARKEDERRRSVLDELKAQGDAGDRMARSTTSA